MKVDLPYLDHLLDQIYAKDPSIDSPLADCIAIRIEFLSVVELRARVIGPVGPSHSFVCFEVGDTNIYFSNYAKLVAIFRGESLSASQRDIVLSIVSANGWRVVPNNILYEKIVPGDGEMWFDELFGYF